MTAPQIAALLVFLFPLAYSPGPGNSFFAAIGASGGLASAWPALIGYHAATFVVTLAIGAGLGLTLLTNPTVAGALKLAGAFYVAGIGVMFLKAAPSDGDAGRGPMRASLLDGAAVLVFNPKAYLIIALMFTQFLPEQASLATLLTITAVFTINNLLAFVIWTLLGLAIGRLIASRMSGRLVNLVFGGCLFGVAAWMALS